MPRWREDPRTSARCWRRSPSRRSQQRGLVYEPKYDGIRALVDLAPAPKSRAKRRRRRTSRSTRATATTRRRSSRRSSPRSATIARTLDGAAAPRRRDRRDRRARARPLGFQHIQGRIHLTADGEIDARRSAISRRRSIALRPAARRRRGPARPAARRAAAAPAGARERRKAAAARWVRLSEIVGRRRPRAVGARARAKAGKDSSSRTAHSPYHSGRRTPAWRKLKLLKQQEFVVGGWTEPRQTRPALRRAAARLLRATAGAALRRAASAPGSIERELDRVAALLAKRARRDESPFADAFKTTERAHWVKPDARRRSPVHGVDERRPAAAAGVSRDCATTRERDRT